MSWPTPQDFVEAVQNPAYCFSDPDLKAGQPVLTPLGLPKVVSGQFACVFKFACGPKSWAVRCFVRDFADTQQRYVAITKELEAAKFPFMAAFSLLQQGIRVRGQWYPVIKMEWLTGKLLGDYIADNLGSREALLNVASELAKICSSLASRRIAHGDLQHGNIVVVGNQLRLIDYDGMYVPALKGRGSHEVGHRNYQHPLRRESDFNDAVDRFSALVIQASVLILAEAPELWGQLKGGDDNLLFRAADFSEPYNSAAFRVLNTHPNSQIRLLASLVEQACYAARLDDVSPSLTLPVVSASSAAVAAAPASSWIEQHRPVSNEKSDTTPIADWVAGHVPIQSPAFREPNRLRIGSILLTLLIVVVLMISWSGALTPVTLGAALLAVAALLLALAQQYRMDPAVVAKRNQSKRVQEYEAVYRNRKREFNAVESSIDDEKGKFDLFKRRVEADASKVDVSLAATLARIDADANAKRQSVLARRIQIDNAEKREQSLITSRFNTTANSVRSEISNINTQLQSELDKELKRVQMAHVSAHLRSASIASAGISGIGEKLTQRLLSAGIRSAEDAEWHRVQAIDGIGVQKASAIRSWRSRVSAEASRTMPGKLSFHADQQLRQQHQSRLNAANIRLREIESRQKAELDSVARGFETQRDALRKEQDAVEGEKRKRMGEASGQAAAERSRLGKSLSDCNVTFGTAMKALAQNLRLTRDAAISAQYQRDVSRRKLASYEKITFSRWLGFHLIK